MLPPRPLLIAANTLLGGVVLVVVAGLLRGCL